MIYEDLFVWLKSNGVSVIIREGFNYDNVEDAIDTDTGLVVGNFYPDGYDKVHCFIDVRSMGNGNDRKNILRAVARKFFAINSHKSTKDATFLVKEYMRKVSNVCGFGVTEYEINGAVFWALENMVSDYKELMVKSYFTFNQRNTPQDIIRRVVMRYMSKMKKARSLMLMEGAIQLQKENTTFITKPSTARATKEVDEHNKGVSISTVKKHWEAFSEDVNTYHSSTFGTDDYNERRAASTIKQLMDSYQKGNTTKIKLHRDTNISRPTIDNYWDIITKA